ncbi:MAG TPA: DivIVA domain-containing protein [Solirubrobacteraceae bacterium]|nr:DivIVA domain-containing protein [Solirubrobacteraceae bacterium]
MALDRQSIEKKDFPIGRRGYDPDAVDAHLHSLAEEIEELKRTARRRNESLAAAASEQVRSIVEAAETTAADIQRQAEDEARDIRVEASNEAATTREHATSEAREYVGQVSESTGGMLERINAMENELNALIESLRTGSNRLNADLQLLEGNLASVKDAVVPRPRFEPETGSRAGSGSGAEQPAAEATPSAVEAAAPAVPSAEPFEESASVAPASGGELLTDPQHEPVPARGTNGGDDDGARLIALNMALNGTPREETDRYLAENFRLTDRRGLLDEVYSSVEG